VTAKAADSDLWIRCYHPAAGSGIRLLCLPHAGGSAPFYHPVSAALAPRVEVLAVQYPGRQDRRLEPCVETIEELADHLLPLVLERWADRPLALFGHSMGASLGFELAGLLEQAGVHPTLLYASGRYAPSRFQPGPKLHDKDDEALLADVRKLAGTDSRVLGDDEVLRMVLPAIRNDYRAAETYRPQRLHRVACPITALVGDADPKVSIDDARAWAQHTTGAFDLWTYFGGHFYLIEYVADVIVRISADLVRTAVGP